jgi:hypothetical protein
LQSRGNHQRSKTGLKNAKFLKVDLLSDTLSDKLAFLEANPSANIKRTLDGEELTAPETTIFECFDNNTDYYIVIVPPTPHFTFKKCTDENSIEDDTKSVIYLWLQSYKFWTTIYLNIGKEIITLPKEMEEKRDSNDISYNRIHLGNPIVSIKSGDNTKHIDASDLFSINATLSYGTSADTHNKAVYLYNKLVSKKDAIDGIFESQPVYAIGPIFHENNTFPFIACWG